MFLFYFIFIEILLIYNVVLVSSVQQSVSVIHIYVYKYVLFQILFHFRLLQDNEYSSLCYAVGPCCLRVLYIVVGICLSQTPNLSPLPCPPPLLSLW